MKQELERLDTIFEIKHGNKFDLNKMTVCGPSKTAIAFIGRSREKNGLVGFVEKLESEDPFDMGLITVALGGSTLSSFVQPRAFYTAQNIDVLKPRKKMNMDVKLYYCLCIEANRFRYSTYGREANRTLKTLLVPALHTIPLWVNGAFEKAITGFSLELADLVKSVQE